MYSSTNGSQDRLYDHPYAGMNFRTEQEADQRNGLSLYGWPGSAESDLVKQEPLHLGFGGLPSFQSKPSLPRLDPLSMLGGLNSTPGLMGGEAGPGPMAYPHLRPDGSMSIDTLGLSSLNYNELIRHPEASSTSIWGINEGHHNSHFPYGPPPTMPGSIQNISTNTVYSGIERVPAMNRQMNVSGQTNTSIGRSMNNPGGAKKGKSRLKRETGVNGRGGGLPPHGNSGRGRGHEPVDVNNIVVISPDANLYETTGLYHEELGSIHIKDIKGVYKNCRGIWAAQWTDTIGQRHTKYFNPKYYASEESARVNAYKFKLDVTLQMERAKAGTDTSLNIAAHHAHLGQRGGVGITSKGSVGPGSQRPYAPPPSVSMAVNQHNGYSRPSGDPRGQQDSNLHSSANQGPTLEVLFCPPALYLPLEPPEQEASIVKPLPEDEYNRQTMSNPTETQGYYPMALETDEADQQVVTYAVMISIVLGLCPCHACACALMPASITPEMASHILKWAIDARLTNKTASLGSTPFLMSSELPAMPPPGSCHGIVPTGMPLHPGQTMQPDRGIDESQNTTMVNHPEIAGLLEVEPHHVHGLVEHESSVVAPPAETWQPDMPISDETGGDTECRLSQRPDTMTNVQRLGSTLSAAMGFEVPDLACCDLLPRVTTPVKTWQSDDMPATASTGSPTTDDNTHFSREGSVQDYLPVVKLEEMLH